MARNAETGDEGAEEGVDAHHFGGERGDEQQEEAADDDVQIAVVVFIQVEAMDAVEDRPNENDHDGDEGQRQQQRVEPLQGRSSGREGTGHGQDHPDDDVLHGCQRDGLHADRLVQQIHRVQQRRQDGKGGETEAGRCETRERERERVEWRGRERSARRPRLTDEENEGRFARGDALVHLVEPTGHGTADAH